MTTTPNTTPSEQRALRGGRIVLVDYPFVDRRQVKTRPAVVISSDAFHQLRNDCLLLAITSRAKSSGVPIVHWRDAGLRKPSFLKPVLATVSQNRCSRILGDLAAEDWQRVRKILKGILWDAWEPELS